MVSENAGLSGGDIKFRDKCSKKKHDLFFISKFRLPIRKPYSPTNPNLTKSNQTKPSQAKPSQTKPNLSKKNLYAICVTVNYWNLLFDW